MKYSPLRSLNGVFLFKLQRSGIAQVPLVWLCSLLVITFLYSPNPANAQDKILFDFSSLDNWKPLNIPSVEKQSEYTIEQTAPDNSILRASSSASASGLISIIEFDPHVHPHLCWRWKVENIYKKGDARIKSGDDYPLRIYVVFPYNAKDFSLWQNAQYESARLIYGEYPPGRSLNYVWSNLKHDKSHFRNAYTEIAELIIKESGNDNLGEWLDEDADILLDYKKAFGVSAPHKARIAIMNDSDDTKESSVSFLDHILLSEKAKPGDCKNVVESPPSRSAQ